MRDPDQPSLALPAGGGQASPGEPNGGPEPHLRACWEAGRAAWPELAIERDFFIRYLADRSNRNFPPLERAADLYLACGCATGTPAAVDAFRRVHLPIVARAIGRIDTSSAFLDDVMQALALRLLVAAEAGGPGIARYSGRSSLRTWVATVATRTALNLRRARPDRGHEPLPSSIRALADDKSPEILVLKARCKAEFDGAVRVALAALAADERALLLLQIRDGLTLPELAKNHGVSRATVARKLARARQNLVELTRRELMSRLRLTSEEYASLVRMVRSQIDLTLTKRCP